jgi:predicted ATPase
LVQDAEFVEIEVWGAQSEQTRNGYRATLYPASNDAPALDEVVLLHDFENNSEPYPHGLGLSRESRLRATAQASDQRNAGIARHVLPILAGCRVFHFHDTSSDAPVKRRVDDADNVTLAPDARNLAALLLRLQSEDATTYRRIVRSIQTVAPFFGDFVLKSEAGSLRLRWQEKGLDNVFSADDFSDGTLRFICLVTLLLQPDRPGTVVLDEPELGLHPFALNQLANLLRGAASESCKLILATQSVTLLSHFEASELAVIERGATGSAVHRLDAAALEAWLEDYSLGELWEKNLLGGRPRPDSTPPEVESAGR